jgi:hypothetical protein
MRFRIWSMTVAAWAAGACVPVEPAGEPPDEGDEQVLPGKFDGPGCARGLERFFEQYARAGGAPDDLASAELWRTPRTARGGGEIQLSWEFEIMSQENVPEWYRPATTTTEEWASLPRWQQLGILRRGGMDFVRRDDAPAWIREVLKREYGGPFETTCGSYTNTLDDLYGQAQVVQSTMGYDGGFHFHVTFPWTGEMRSEAHAMRALLQRGNEYTTYRWLSAGRNWNNWAIAPIDATTLDATERALAEGDVIASSYKFTSLGWRAGIYGDVDRVGFELRSINQEIDDATRMLESLVRGAEDPANAVIKFGSEGAPYRLADAAAGDWIGQGSFARLPDDVQEFLRAVAGAGGSRGRTGMEAWSLPMVSLESRPQIPADAGRLVVAERENYLTAIRAVRDQFAGRTISFDTAGEIIPLVQSAVSDFCRATRPAWEHL